MTLQKTERGWVLKSNYAEYQQFQGAGRMHPAREAGFSWNKADKVWFTSNPLAVAQLEGIVESYTSKGLNLPTLQEDVPAAPVNPAIPAATYTVAWGDGTHTTFKVDAPWEGAAVAPGVMVLKAMCGSDNESSFTGIAFINPDGTTSVWRKAQTQDWDLTLYALDFLVAEGLTAQASGREAYAIMSGKCARCGRKLTVPASVHRGLGPECATHY